MFIGEFQHNLDAKGRMGGAGKGRGKSGGGGGVRGGGEERGFVFF